MMEKNICAAFANYGTAYKVGQISNTLREPVLPTIRPLLALRTGEPMSSAVQGKKTSFSSIQHEDETFPAYFSEQSIFLSLA
jgi:hypothetical protein